MAGQNCKNHKKARDEAIQILKQQVRQVRFIPII